MLGQVMLFPHGVFCICLSKKSRKRSFIFCIRHTIKICKCPTVLHTQKEQIKIILSIKILFRCTHCSQCITIEAC